MPSILIASICQQEFEPLLMLLQRIFARSIGIPARVIANVAISAATGLSRQLTLTRARAKRRAKAIGGAEASMDVQAPEPVMKSRPRERRNLRSPLPH